MVVLVTGAAGFIGSNLIEQLLVAGHSVVGLDNFEPFYDPAIKRANLESLVGLGSFTFVEGDIRDRSALRRTFESREIDAVIHLAAMAGVRPSIRDPLHYSDVNLTGTMILLEEMRNRNVKRLVFGSSSSVYGGSSDVPFREDQAADRPVSPYAATKRAGEILCHSHHHLFGLEVACLRFFTVYGPRQRPEMAIHAFTRQISEGQPIPFFGDGSSRRDYTFVSDIVDGVIAALDRAKGYQVYNLGGSSTVSLAELVKLIEERVGRPAVYDRKSEQPGDVPITYADVSKARAEIGYDPKVDIRAGLDRFVEWYRATQPTR